MQGRDALIKEISHFSITLGSIIYSSVFLPLLSHHANPKQVFDQIFPFIKSTNYEDNLQGIVDEYREGKLLNLETNTAYVEELIKKKKLAAPKQKEQFLTLFNAYRRLQYTLVEMKNCTQCVDDDPLEFGKVFLPAVHNIDKYIHDIRCYFNSSPPSTSLSDAPPAIPDTLKSLFVLPAALEKDIASLKQKAQKKSEEKEEESEQTHTTQKLINENYSPFVPAIFKSMFNMTLRFLSLLKDKLHQQEEDVVDSDLQEEIDAIRLTLSEFEPALIAYDAEGIIKKINEEIVKKYEVIFNKLFSKLKDEVVKQELQSLLNAFLNSYKTLFSIHEIIGKGLLEEDRPTIIQSTGPDKPKAKKKFTDIDIEQNTTTLLSPDIIKKKKKKKHFTKQHPPTPSQMILKVLAGKKETPSPSANDPKKPADIFISEEKQYAADLPLPSIDAWAPSRVELPSSPAEEPEKLVRERQRDNDGVSTTALLLPQLEAKPSVQQSPDPVQAPIYYYIPPKNTARIGLAITGTVLGLAAGGLLSLLLAPLTGGTSLLFYSIVVIASLAGGGLLGSIGFFGGKILDKQEADIVNKIEKKRIDARPILSVDPATAPIIKFQPEQEDSTLETSTNRSSPRPGK